MQAIYAPLQAMGRTKTFGGIPGEVQPYGFGSVDAVGSMYTVMNPAQSVQQIKLPLLSQVRQPLTSGRILFRDAGFLPVLNGNEIKLGPGQLAVVGFGSYADARQDLGVQEDVRIPVDVAPIPASFHPAGHNTIEATVQPPTKGDFRIVMRQIGKDGHALGSWPGGPPNGKSVGKVFILSAQQNSKEVPIEIQYDKLIWSGLSWAVGEIRHHDLAPTMPVTIRCSSQEKDSVALECGVFSITY